MTAWNANRTAQRLLTVLAVWSCGATAMPREGRETILTEQQLTQADEPYIAFNIWSYDGGRLKLAAVKRIPAAQVLGSSLQDAFADDGSDLLVLSDSLLIAKGNETNPSQKNVDPQSFEATTKSYLESDLGEIDSTSNYPRENFDENKPLTFLLDDLPIIDEMVKVIKIDTEKLKNDLNNFQNRKSESSVKSDINVTDKSSIEKEESHAAIEHPENQSSQFPQKSVYSDDMLTSIDTIKNSLTSPIAQANKDIVNIVNTDGKVSSTNNDEIKFITDSLHSDGDSLNFTTMNVNKNPAKIQISLINDEGVPVNKAALVQANLVSIISNKPTVVNNNIYHIQVNDSTFSKHDINVFKDSALSEDGNSQKNPYMKLKYSLQKFANAENTPEEELLSDLSEIGIFSSLMSSRPIPVPDSTEVNNLVIKGITDVNPQLMSDVHTVETTNIPRPTLVSKDNKDDEKNLQKLESLLKKNELPYSVQVNIIRDIVNGSTVREALDRHTDVYKSETTNENDPSFEIFTEDTMISPLTIIDSVDSTESESINNKFLDLPSPTVLPEDTDQRLTNTLTTNSLNKNMQNCFTDRACIFAFAVALAAGTTGAMSVPFLVGRSLKGISQLEMIQPENPSKLMSRKEADQVMKAIMKYVDQERNGRQSKKYLRKYLRPFVTYLGHVAYPDIFGHLPVST